MTPRICLLLALATGACRVEAEIGDRFGASDTSDTASGTSPQDVVGVRTVATDNGPVEVWYPATGTPGVDEIDVASLLPASFLDAVEGTVDVPTFEQAAVRDATPRPADAPYPVVVFSHGFGGFRTQSASLAVELASAGYVVLAVDHPGRTLGDVVPCLLTSLGDACAISFPGTGGGDGDDPAVADVGLLLDGLAPLVADLNADTERIGLFGHSAGGGTTARVASTDPRIDAALALAGAGELTRALPSAIVASACDAIVPEPALVATGTTWSQGTWSLAASGHLAPSDLCDLELGELADQIGELDDANAIFLFGLERLATDGCPGSEPTIEGPTCGAFLPIRRAKRIYGEAVVAFFDQHLSGRGLGLAGLTFDELTQAER